MNDILERCLIIADGDFNKRLIKKFISQNSPRKSYLIISADGTSNTLLKYKIIPDYIIGDLDSVSSETINYFKKKGVVVKKIFDQEHNDLEKCIMFALTRGCNTFSVIGFGGKRIDHTLNNFSILKKYSRKCNIRFIDDLFETKFLDKKISIDYKKDEMISLIAFPKTAGITTSGLQYNLKNETLELGVREGALNLSTSKTINIKFKSGNLMIVKKHFGHLKFYL